jgi:hypothetical protein
VVSDSLGQTKGMNGPTFGVGKAQLPMGKKIAQFLVDPRVNSGSGRSEQPHAGQVILGKPNERYAAPGAWRDIERY